MFIETKVIGFDSRTEKERAEQALKLATTEHERLAIRIRSVLNNARQQHARENRLRTKYGPEILRSRIAQETKVIG